MFYLQTIKNLGASIKNNDEIPAEEKAKAQQLLGELARLLALY